MNAPQDYEARLRAALVEAEAADHRIAERFDGLDAHPNSNEYQGEKTMALMAAGRVMGLQQALNLLTGEETEANLAMIQMREARKAR